jgi:membrane peptidoglycan carboxypeptidase
MMEHVVLAGTGKKAHVMGYTTAGKTGTAQIFDFAHHMYTHRHNATFMGFAPVTNPSVVVVVTVSPASGEAAWVAAPAFRTVMEEALRLKGVPRDIPAELEAANKTDQKLKDAKPESETDSSIAELGDPPTLEDERAALGEDSNTDAVLVAENDVSAPKTPDFIGKTVKDVVEEAAEQGIHIEAKGEGLARVQRPAPGEQLRPGEAVRVLFKR